MSIQTKFDMSNNYVVPVISFPYSFPLYFFQNLPVLALIDEYSIGIYMYLKYRLENKYGIFFQATHLLTHKLRKPKMVIL